MNHDEVTALLAALVIMACAIALMTGGVADFVTPYIDKSTPLYHALGWL